MRIKFLAAIIFTLFFMIPAFAANEKIIVKVAISNQSFSSWDYQKIKFQSEDTIKIIDMSKSEKLNDIEPNKPIEIVFEDGFNIYVNDSLEYKNLQGPLTLSSNKEIQILDLNRKGAPARYYGLIELRASRNNTRFNVINIIDMQNYLRGVVPNEMPVSFGLEALKAQAVAARNYALNANINPNYDVVDSTASQVYYGINSHRDISDRAVSETEGIYAIYNEEPISALYFSTSPGITDDWDDVFGDGTESNKHPYLKARYDDENQKPLKSEEDVKKFYSDTKGGIDLNSPKYRWNIEFERKELEEILHNTLQAQSKAGLVTPNYDGDIKLEGLKEIKPIKRTQSGKITELEIVAKTGEYRIKKELGIRRVFKKGSSILPSANFFVVAEGKEKLEKLEDGTKDHSLIDFFSFEDDENYPTVFKFTGGGFGHSVGMSQYGAYNLAKKGEKYSEILKHYYTDIKLSTIPKTVLYNEYNIFYKTEFYFDKKAYKEAYLFINNQKGVNEFPFKINEYEFLSTKEISKNKVIKINITQYLKEGKNTIVFAPLTRENRGKYVKYRVEFQ